MKNLAEYISEARMLGQGWERENNGKYEATILAFPEPSQSGIDKGRISKLDIRDMKTREIVVRYDRGWDIKPNGREVEKFYNEILKKYN